MILGPSASGKSTLLNMLGGLDSLDEGTIMVDGVDITKLGRKELMEYRRKKIGVVFQPYNLIAELGAVVLCQDLVQVKMRNFSPF